MLIILSALASEFFGTLLFAFFGALAPPQYAAAANGLALAVLVYCAVAQSGGHLNPNVTASLVLSGHTSLLQGGYYILCQLVGAIVGAGITKGFGRSPGCFLPADGVSHAALWGWETIMTTLLIVTVYEVAVVQKGASNVGPLVIGLSLFVAASVGGAATGAALNFARVLGPAVVNGCGWSTVWVYLLAHLTAVAFATAWGLLVAPNGPYLNTWKGLTNHFVPAVPYSTASNPLVPYKNVGRDTATSLPPYARYNETRQSIPAAEHHRLSALGGTDPAATTTGQHNAAGL